MRIRLVGAACVVLAIAGVAEASLDVATIVRIRQSNFRTLLSLHRAIKGELTRGAPRMAVVSRAAAQEAVLA